MTKMNEYGKKIVAQHSSSHLPIYMSVVEGGRHHRIDLATLPHLLIGGATGKGNAQVLIASGAKRLGKPGLGYLVRGSDQLFIQTPLVQAWSGKPWSKKEPNGPQTGQIGPISGSSNRTKRASRSLIRGRQTNYLKNDFLWQRRMNMAKRS